MPELLPLSVSAAPTRAVAAPAQARPRTAPRGEPSFDAALDDAQGATASPASQDRSERASGTSADRPHRTDENAPGVKTPGEHDDDAREDVAVAHAQPLLLGPLPPWTTDPDVTNGELPGEDAAVLSAIVEATDTDDAAVPRTPVAADRATPIGPANTTVAAPPSAESGAAFDLASVGAEAVPADVPTGHASIDQALASGKPDLAQADGGDERASGAAAAPEIARHAADGRTGAPARVIPEAINARVHAVDRKPQETGAPEAPTAKDEAHAMARSILAQHAGAEQAPTVQIDRGVPEDHHRIPGPPPAAAGQDASADDSPLAAGFERPAASRAGADGLNAQTNGHGRSLNHGADSGHEGLSAATRDHGAAIAPALSAPAFARQLESLSPMVATAGAPTLVADADVPDQIVRQMQLQWRDGVGRATLRLNPEHLGEVVVEMRVEDHRVAATLRAETPAVRAWIETHRQELASGLADCGLRLEELRVDTRDDAREEGRQAEQELPQRRPRRRASGGARFEVHA